jgi:hypothetical protein
MRHGKSFRIGACVVLREERRESHPSRGARDVRPERYGEGYSFVVDEFCRISEQRAGRLLLNSQWGRTRVADATDPRLHIASWWERLFY